MVAREVKPKPKDAKTINVRISNPIINPINYIEKERKKKEKEKLITNPTTKNNYNNNQNLQV